MTDDAHFDTSTRVLVILRYAFTPRIPKRNALLSKQENAREEVWVVAVNGAAFQRCCCIHPRPHHLTPNPYNIHTHTAPATLLPPHSSHLLPRSRPAKQKLSTPHHNVLTTSIAPNAPPRNAADAPEAGYVDYALRVHRKARGAVFVAGGGVVLFDGVQAGGWGRGGLGVMDDRGSWDGIGDIEGKGREWRRRGLVFVLSGSQYQDCSRRVTGLHVAYLGVIQCTRAFIQTL